MGQWKETFAAQVNESPAPLRETQPWEKRAGVHSSPSQCCQWKCGSSTDREENVPRSHTWGILVGFIQGQMGAAPGSVLSPSVRPATGKVRPYLQVGESKRVSASYPLEPTQSAVGARAATVMWSRDPGETETQVQ